MFKTLPVFWNCLLEIQNVLIVWQIFFLNWNTIHVINGLLWQISLYPKSYRCFYFKQVKFVLLIFFSIFSSMAKSHSEVNCTPSLGHFTLCFGNSLHGRENKHLPHDLALEVFLGFGWGQNSEDVKKQSVNVTNPIKLKLSWVLVLHWSLDKQYSISVGSYDAW